MNTYQDIKTMMDKLIAKTTKLYAMNREDIFILLSELVAVSQTISDYIRELDMEMAHNEQHIKANVEPMPMAAINRAVKEKNTSLITEKDWCNRQLKIIQDLRISALAAQRSSE